MTEQAELQEDEDSTESFHVRQLTDYDFRSEAMSAAVRVTVGELDPLRVVNMARAIEAYLRGPEMED